MHERVRLFVFGKRIRVSPSSSTKRKPQIVKTGALYVTQTRGVVSWGLQGCRLSLALSRQTKSITSPFVLDFGKPRTNEYSTKHLKAIMVFIFYYYISYVES